MSVFLLLFSNDAALTRRDFKITFHGCWPCAEMGNQGLQHGSLDFSDYWFPSPVRQGDRSAGFRHGGHSLNPPFWLARSITVGQTPTDWRLTETPELFFACVLFFSAFLVTSSHTSVFLSLSHLRVALKYVPLLECRTTWAFKRSLLKKQRNIRGEMRRKKKKKPQKRRRREKSWSTEGEKK